MDQDKDESNNIGKMSTAHVFNQTDESNHLNQIMNSENIDQSENVSDVYSNLSDCDGSFDETDLGFPDISP